MDQKRRPSTVTVVTRTRARRLLVIVHGTIGQVGAVAYPKWGNDLVNETSGVQQSLVAFHARVPWSRQGRAEIHRHHPVANFQTGATGRAAVLHVVEVGRSKCGELSNAVLEVATRVRAHCVAWLLAAPGFVAKG